MQEAYENEDEQQHHIDFTLAQKTAVFVPAALAACGLDALLQAPLPLAVGGVVGAFILAKKSPQIYENLRKYLPASQQSPDPQPGQTVEMVEGEWTLMDRLLGRHLDENGNPLPPPLRAQPKEATKDEDQAQSDDSTLEEQAGMDVTPPPVDPSEPAIPVQFTLQGESLAAIKDVNTKRFVYFGKSINRQVLLHIDEMYHVLDVAKSGRGKSNRFRGAMMQVVNMADTYYINPFAAPVKVVKDTRRIEVWQPIYDRLANRHPVRESEEILQVLNNLLGEIARRNEMEQDRDFSWRERPIFVFIDEVPEVNARCPNAAIPLIDRIGRGGRQFGVFLWLATQTAQVKDIGLSTASQAQFKTIIYGGSDKTSSNRVMGGLTPEMEKTLRTGSAGLTLMVADGLEDTEFVRAPLITNEALFAFLGLPPFNINEWLTPKSKQPVQRLTASSPTSQADSVPASPSTSAGRSNAQTLTPSEGRNEEARSGSEAGDRGEVGVMGFSERELRISEMFFNRGLGINDIMRELYPGVTGGEKYQKASTEIANTLRKYAWAQQQKGS